jgi:hypothetical protein
VTCPNVLEERSVSSAGVSTSDPEDGGNKVL